MKFPFHEQIVLENDRVRLEPLELSHVDALTPIAIKYPGLCKYMSYPFGTREDMVHYVQSSLDKRANRERYSFVIFDKPTRTYAGSTSFLNIVDKDSRLEIGSTWVSKDFHRTGLNRHCKFLLMTFAFETLKCERLEFKTDARNKQSQKAIKAIGGKFEGTLRSHSVMSDGFRRDTVYYSVLKEEWPGIKTLVFSEMNT